MFKELCRFIKTIAGILSLIVTLPFIIGAASCESMTSQNPKELFEDGKLPKDLIRIQSQVLGLSLKEKEAIIERVKADEKRTDLIKVAVIDSGVDLIHPDLQPYLDYKIVDGKIIGVGYDFMTGQPFGSNVFFDASLFSYGSGGIRKGKIVNKNENPLRLIKETNTRFRELIISGIQSDPVLSKSFFRYLTAESFTIFGMESILQNMGQTLREFEKAKAKGKLENEQTILDPDKKYLAEALDPKRGAWSQMRLIDSQIDIHLPQALGSFERLESADLFLNLVKKSYETVDAEFNYRRNYQQLKQFIAVNQGIDINDPELDKSVTDKLMKSTEFILYGADIYNPLIKLEKIFKEVDKYKELNLTDSITLFLNDMKSYKEKVKNMSNLTKEEIKYLKSYDTNLSNIESILNELIRLAHDPKLLAEFKSNLRREVYRTNHPYIDQRTNSNIHATHVSSTIIRQLLSLIRIIPIRVTTQSIALQKDISSKLADEMLAEYTEWSKNSFYGPLKELILAEYGLSKMDESDLKNELKKQLEMESMNTVFIKQLFEAIQKVGELGAQLANVSLGMAYEKSYKDNNKKGSLVQDLFSEFVRYKTGELLRDKAPKTLFFVATGNEKAWIDGVTRVAFPVGIRSPRMQALTKKLNIPDVPNNLVENLIPVISVNEKGFLTEFANQFIVPNEKAIGSTGEEIMASTPKSSKAGTESIVNKLFAPTVAWLAQLNVTLINEGRKRLDSGEISYDEWEIESQSQKVSSGLVRKLKDLMVETLHLKNPINRQKLSGTSMATPSATGKTAVLISEMLKNLNAKSSDLFNHTQLKMSDIVKSVYAHAVEPPYKLLTQVKVYTSGLKLWPRSKGEKATVDELKAMLKSNRDRSDLTGNMSGHKCTMIFNH